MDCSSISKGLVAGSCGKLPIGGTGYRAIFLNYNDVDKEGSTYDATKGLISEIAMKTGKKGYLFESMENSFEGSATFEKGTYMDQYTHQVVNRIFADNEDALEFLHDLKGARVIEIVERREAGSSHWQVYGWESGLKLSENAFSTTYADNVAFNPTLASDDTSKESDLPAIFYKTSAAATEAAVLALCQTSAAAQ